MRRHFDLPEEDVEYLNAMGLPWEAVADAGNQWVLVHNFPVPEGYTVESTTVAIRIPSNYPTAGLDMASLEPSLARTNGRSIDRLVSSSIEGRDWQTWSRHYSSENPWRPEEDSLGSHLRLVEHWLERELQKP